MLQLLIDLNPHSYCCPLTAAWTINTWPCTMYQTWSTHGSLTLLILT
jgi:hypothetical protein